MLLRHVRNPIKLAQQLLIRGEEADGGGAADHCQYSGDFVEGLAKEWGLDIVDSEYFFTQKRWDEHQRGLADEKKNLLTYLFDKHGARGAPNLKGVNRLEKEMRRLDTRTSMTP